MSRDFDDLGISLTEKQIERQINKLKKLFFEDYEELDDGSYKGEVVEELVDIINKHVLDKEEITQNEFLEAVRNCAMSIFVWANDRLKGVDERLMSLYCFDFANQSLNTMYSLTFVDKSDDSDSMYV